MSYIMNPLLWAAAAAVLVFMPNEAAEFLGLVDLRPGKWIAP